MDERKFITSEFACLLRMKFSTLVMKLWCGKHFIRIFTKSNLKQAVSVTLSKLIWLISFGTISDTRIFSTRYVEAANNNQLKCSHKIQRSTVLTANNVNMNSFDGSRDYEWKHFQFFWIKFHATVRWTVALAHHFYDFKWLNESFRIGIYPLIVSLIHVSEYEYQIYNVFFSSSFCPICRISSWYAYNLNSLHLRHVGLLLCRSLHEWILVH